MRTERASRQEISPQPKNLEQHFAQFRPHMINPRLTFQSPSGLVDNLYMDTAALGPGYGPIKAWMGEVAKHKANTHTTSTETGAVTGGLYELAIKKTKEHVHADERDILMWEGSGMTAAVNKQQRLLGMKAGDQLRRAAAFQDTEIPEAVELFLEKISLNVDVSHKEHHSNQTSWLETDADVSIMPINANGDIDLEQFEKDLAEDTSGKIKIVAVSAASNVTGLKNPLDNLAKIVHAAGGYIMADFAAGAPHMKIDMHPEDEDARLDAIYFSGEKFIEGPNVGVLIMSKDLYNKVRHLPPDRPGGGTVEATDPWGGRVYHATDDLKNGATEAQDTRAIEEKENGGTPPIEQAIILHQSIKLKEVMGIENIEAREKEIAERLIDGLSEIPEVHVLEGDKKDRLGIVSFYMEKLRDPDAEPITDPLAERKDHLDRRMHYNLVAKLLDNEFGIQTRGGCSCAGTYGHVLLGVDKLWSKEIIDAIRTGDNSTKPGWTRVSPMITASNQELDAFVDAVKYVAKNYDELAKDYTYNPVTNEFTHKNENPHHGLVTAQILYDQGAANLVPTIEPTGRKVIVAYD